MLPHHLLPIDKPYAFKSRTELAIEKYAGKENPTEADLNSVLIAGQIEEGIAKMLGYINVGCSLSRGRLEEEDHCSKDLGERLVLAGSNKPYPRCHAHAIISGGHGKADTLRAILAKLK